AVAYAPEREVNREINILGNQMNNRRLPYSGDRPSACRSAEPVLPVGVAQRSIIGEVSKCPLSVCWTEKSGETAFGRGIENALSAAASNPNVRGHTVLILWLRPIGAWSVAESNNGPIPNCRRVGQLLRESQDSQKDDDAKVLGVNHTEHEDIEMEENFQCFLMAVQSEPPISAGSRRGSEEARRR